MQTLSDTSVLPLHSADGEALRRRWIIANRPRLLVSYPVSERPSAPLLDLLRELEVETALSTRGGRGALPDLGAVHIALVVGSEPLQEAAESGRLEQEIDWLRRADAAGTRLRGIGHGARLLALAFGGEVTPAAAPYRGWMMVGSAVPHLIPHGPWLARQHDSVTLPPGAETLAGNRLGPQAFRIGRHLAVNFHPEATVESARDWGERPTAPIGTGHDPQAARARTRRLLRTLVQE